MKYLSELTQAKIDLMSRKNPTDREFWGTWRDLTKQLRVVGTPELLLAIHEAGHAVMKWVMGDSFEDVTIVPSDDCSDSAIMDAFFPRRLVMDLVSKSPCKASIMFMDRQMIILLAGYAAEALFLETNEADSSMSNSDCRIADDIISRWFGRDYVFGGYVAAMRKNAIDSIERFWLQVAILAIELLEKKTVSYDEVICLLESVP